MVHQYRFVLAILLLVSGKLIHAQPSDKSKAILQQYRVAYGKGLMDKKATFVAAYYSDNARLMAPFQKTVFGVSSINAYYTAFATRFVVSEFNRTPIEIIDTGQVLVACDAFTTTLTSQTGKRYQLAGKFMSLWQKAGDGSIRLATEAWNFDQQVDFIDQLKFNDVPSTDVALQAHVPINNNINLELAAFNRLLERTVTEHDAPIWTLFYADDVLLLHGGAPPKKGRKAVGDFLVEHCRQMPIFEKLDIRNDRVDQLGQYVVEYASHIAIVRGGEWSGVSMGKDLRLWKRDADGSLKMVMQLGNYD